MFGEARRAAWMEVDLAALRHNFAAVRKAAPGAKTIATVKADAYGHGAVKVAWEFVKEKADFLAVATLDEAVEIRSAGIGIPLLMYGLVPRKNAKDIIDNRITPVVSSLHDAKLLSEACLLHGSDKTVDILLAVDTGMTRLGFSFTEEGIADIVSVAKLPNIRIVALFSHFATSDEADNSYALKQLAIFESFEKRLSLEGVKYGSKTMANSGATALLPQAHFDIVRPGLILYGLHPSEATRRSGLELRPAMSVKANIVLLRRVPAGTAIGYGRKFVTERESLIATLPIGYADGYRRALTNSGRVIVRGHYAPVVGSVCMDQCMIDVTAVPGVSEYDEVIIMGESDGLAVTADELGEKTGTISYEVLTAFGQRLPRVYIQGE